MYFPEEILEIRNILRSLDDKVSNYEKIAIIDSCIERLEHFRPGIVLSYSLDWTRIKNEILEELRIARIDCERSMMSVGELRDILFEINNKVKISVSDIKPYKNLCIFILFHPKNNAIASAEILSRMNYLDKMIRDVTIIMPGYKRATPDDEVVNEADKNLPLTFDEDLFIEMVQKLENESNGKFLYNDMCELVFIGLRSNGKYDFDNFQRLDLNILSHKRGIDPIKLILTIAQRFRNDKAEAIQINKYVNQILGELTMQDSCPTIKVFIAGAKRLKVERSLLREELSKVENRHNLDIRSLTFEDFATSLTGNEKGRQADYNKFIKEEANIVIFIFDSTAGEITEEEFDVAYTSLKENKHPDIFVYVRKRNKLSLRGIFRDRRLQNIKNKVFSIQKEYYIEYENLDNLRYLFMSGMHSYFQQKIVNE